MNKVRPGPAGVQQEENHLRANCKNQGCPVRALLERGFSLWTETLPSRERNSEEN